MCNNTEYLQLEYMWLILHPFFHFLHDSQKQVPAQTCHLPYENCF